MPKLAIAVLMLALVALASTLSYAAYLVVGVISDYLDIGRLMAGLVLAGLFARVPFVRKGKLRTVGLLPRNARLPVMAALLALSLVSFLFQGETLPALILGLAATFVLALRWIRRKVLERVLSFLSGSRSGPLRPTRNDETIIDAEFREKKD